MTTPGLATAQSFSTTLEGELLARHRFRTKSEPRLAVFSYSETWYNRLRRHSVLSQWSPVTDECETSTAA